MGEDCITQEILDMPLILDLNLIKINRENFRNLIPTEHFTGTVSSIYLLKFPVKILIGVMIFLR